MHPRLFNDFRVGEHKGQTEGSTDSLPLADTWLPYTTGIVVSTGTNSPWCSLKLVCRLLLPCTAHCLVCDSGVSGYSYVVSSQSGLLVLLIYGRVMGLLFGKGPMVRTSFSKVYTVCSIQIIYLDQIHPVIRCLRVGLLQTKRNTFNRKRRRFVPVILATKYKC